MITIGVDPHKQTHTAVAIRAGSGELLGEHTAPARAPGSNESLAWSREIDHERVWAVEDCRPAQDRVRWHLHDLWPELLIPPGALDREKWLVRVSRRLGRSQPVARVRIMRQLVRQIRRLTREANELEREIAKLVVAYAPQLLTLPGCGALIAGRIIGETAGITRFRNDAQLARLAGVAPLDASSGQQRRHRLNRHGNRSPNSALHKIAVVQGRIDPRAQAFLARKQHEGKTRREALRALKRHLAQQPLTLAVQQGDGLG